MFLLELKTNKALWKYYKFFNDDKNFLFRKAYFCQRLAYIAEHIGSNDQAVWDCGCGYGTTALFLAMNGYAVYGTTLEFYIDELANRKAFWSQYGDVGLFEYGYENLLDSSRSAAFDVIILQDTLHHLEPIESCVSILRRAAKPGGRLLIVEENGRNPIQNLKLLKQRGFRRKIEIYDSRL